MAFLKCLGSPALKCSSTDILEVEGKAGLDSGSHSRLESDHSITVFPALKCQQNSLSVLYLHILSCVSFLGHPRSGLQCTG